jgi:hypothetical protein
MGRMLLGNYNQAVAAGSEILPLPKLVAAVSK